MEALVIRSESGKLIPMKFSESQEVLWETIGPVLDQDEKLWFIVLKGRQVYASTFFEALAFTRTMEQPGTETLVLAQDLDSSHALFNMARRFYEHLPLPKMVPSKVKEVIFPFPAGASRFKVVSAGTSTKGRGTTQTCIHASEVAFWPQPDILTGISQALPDLPNTMFILESTANGKMGIGRLFYNEWCRSIEGISDLVPIFIPWYLMKKYVRKVGVEEKDWNEEERTLVETFKITPQQLAWRRFIINTKCQGDVDYFHQEYPTTPEEAFISSGLPAFNRLALLRQRPNICQPLYHAAVDLKKKAVIKHPKGSLRIWKEPIPDRLYVIGADTALGIERGDASCAEVIDMITLEQVACIHGQIAPYDFSIMLDVVGRYYNKALLAVERNNTGHAVQEPLIKIHNYPNLHIWRGRPDKIKWNKPTQFGWDTNSVSRPLLIECGQRNINKDLVTIHEEKLIEELSNFSLNDSGKYEAETGHDDRVLAFLIALRSRQENYAPKIHVPVMSEGTLPRGIRIVEDYSDTANFKKRIGRLLRLKARQEATSTDHNNWMTK